MTINKFQGKTEAEAVEKAKSEMGADVVIMNVREIKPGGIFRFFKSSVYEVTAAREEKEQSVNLAQALKSPLKQLDNINYTADESISIPPFQTHRPSEKAASASKTVKKDTEHKDISQKEWVLEEKLENLQNILEKSLSGEDRRDAEEFVPHVQENSAERSEGFQGLKMVYKVLLDNEVNEKYVNQILDDVEKVARSGSSMDLVLSNIYQKMILKFGQPKKIELSEGGLPKVVFFIGPTGVGKTTTIAKIASKFKVDMGKKVAFLTADTYRIAAAEQLRTYANILDTPLTIIYSADELNAAIERVDDFDLVLVDTAGFSHKNENQREDVKHLIESLDEKYEKEVYLVVSATIKYRDLLEISDIYHEIADYKIIFTKLDETTTYGNILNVRMHSGAELSYVTDGQNVPDDIELFDTQKVVKQLLGGR